MSESVGRSANVNNRIAMITESAVMIALAAVLSMVKLIDLPYSGSVTPASALPLIIIAYRYGVGWGCLTGLVYSLTQMVTTSSFGYVTGFWSVVAVVALDFLLAFTTVGFAGLFRRSKKQPLAMMGGAILFGALRYLCHVIAGATVWAGIAIPTGAALAYSLSYNLTYMLPETIILAAAAYMIGSVLDFRTPAMVRVEREAASGSGLMKAAAAGLITAAVVYDVAQIFPLTQDDEGNFVVNRLAEANWTAMGILTAAAVIAALVLILISRRKKAVKAEAEAKSAATQEQQEV